MSGTKDKIYWARGGLRGLVVRSFDPPSDPRAWDDMMKFSHCENTLVEDVTVPAGRENALDVVRGKDYTFRRSRFLGGGVSGATIKGDLEGWTFDDCVVDDGVEVGQFDNYWKPGTPPTRKGLIKDTRSSTGQPIPVWLWHAEPPEVVNSNVEIKRVPRWTVWAYFLVRYVWVRVTRVNTTPNDVLTDAAPAPA